MVVLAKLLGTSAVLASVAAGAYHTENQMPGEGNGSTDPITDDDGTETDIGPAVTSTVETSQYPGESPWTESTTNTVSVTAASSGYPVAATASNVPPPVVITDPIDDECESDEPLPENPADPASSWIEPATSTASDAGTPAAPAPYPTETVEGNGGHDHGDGNDGEDDEECYDDESDDPAEPDSSDSGYPAITSSADNSGDHDAATPTAVMPSSIATPPAVMPSSNASPAGDHGSGYPTPAALGSASSSAVTPGYSSPPSAIADSSASAASACETYTTKTAWMTHYHHVTVTVSETLSAAAAPSESWGEHPAGSPYGSPPAADGQSSNSSSADSDNEGAVESSAGYHTDPNGPGSDPSNVGSGSEDTTSSVSSYPTEIPWSNSAGYPPVAPAGSGTSLDDFPAAATGAASAAATGAAWGAQPTGSWSSVAAGSQNGSVVLNPATGISAASPAGSSSTGSAVVTAGAARPMGAMSSVVAAVAVACGLAALPAML